MLQQQIYAGFVLVLQATSSLALVLAGLFTGGTISMILVIWHQRTVSTVLREEMNLAWDEMNAALRSLLAAVQRKRGRSVILGKAAIAFSKYRNYKRYTLVGRLDFMLVMGFTAIGTAAVGTDFWDVVLYVYRGLKDVAG